MAGARPARRLQPRSAHRRRRRRRRRRDPPGRRRAGQRHAGGAGSDARRGLGVRGDERPRALAGPAGAAAAGCPSSPQVADALGGDFDVRMLPIDALTFRHAYNGIANSTLWFVLHHALRRCRSSRSSTPPGGGSGRPTCVQPRPSPTRWPRRRRRGRDGDGAGLPPVPRPADAARRCGRTCGSAHFTHTPWVPPDYFAMLPDDVAARDARRHARRRPARLPHASAGRSCSAIPARRCSARDAGRACTVFPLGVGRADELPNAGRAPRRRERARAAARRCRRPPGHRPGRPHRAVQERRGAACSPTASCCAPGPSGTTGSCTSSTTTRPGRTCRTTASTRRSYRAPRPRDRRRVRHRRLDAAAARRSPTTTRRALAALRRERRGVRQPGPRRHEPGRPGGLVLSERDPALVLSREAGAADVLGDDALLVNPFDVTATADALHAALLMPASERRERAERMRAAAARLPPDRLVPGPARRAGLTTGTDSTRRIASSEFEHSGGPSSDRSAARRTSPGTSSRRADTTPHAARPLSRRRRDRVERRQVAEVVAGEQHARADRCLPTSRSSAPPLSKPGSRTRARRGRRAPQAQLARRARPRRRSAAALRRARRPAGCARPARAVLSSIHTPGSRRLRRARRAAGRAASREAGRIRHACAARRPAIVSAPYRPATTMPGTARSRPARSDVSASRPVITADRGTGAGEGPQRVDRCPAAVGLRPGRGRSARACRRSRGRSIGRAASRAARRQPPASARTRPPPPHGGLPRSPPGPDRADVLAEWDSRAAMCCSRRSVAAHRRRSPVRVRASRPSGPAAPITPARRRGDASRRCSPSRPRPRQPRRDRCGRRAAATPRRSSSTSASRSQHLWMCAQPRRSRDTPVTTGMVGEYTNTPTGSYRIQGSRPDQTLTLNTGAHLPVKYWIPFDAPLFGFHDSSWQNFPYGSPKYRTDGSHGCVHMPLAAIAFLYGWADVGATVASTPEPAARGRSPQLPGHRSQSVPHADCRSRDTPADAPARRRRRCENQGPTRRSRECGDSGSRREPTRSCTCTCTPSTRCSTARPGSPSCSPRPRGWACRRWR